MALFALLVWRLPRTEFVRQHARSLLVSQLSSYLSRPVAVGSVDFRLLPLSFELRDLVIGGPRQQDPPMATVDRIWVEADFADLRHPVLTLRRVDIERPRLYLEFFAEGGHNLVKLRRREKRFRALEVHIAALSVDEAELSLDQWRMPVSLSAQAVRSRLLGVGERRLRGQLIAQEVEVNLPGAHPYAVSVALEGVYQRGRLDLASARLSAPGVWAHGRGSFRWREERATDLKVVGGASTDLFTRLGYLKPGQADGRIAFDTDIAWRPEAWGYRGTVKSEEFFVWGRRLSGVTGVLSGDRHTVRLDLERAFYGGGTVSGTVTVGVPKQDRPVDVDLTFRGVEADPVLADFNLPLDGIAGRFAGDLSYHCTANRPRRGDGWAEFKVTAVEPLSREFSLFATLPLVIGGGIVRSDAIRLRSAGQLAVARGSYDLARQTGQFDYQISTSNVGSIARLLPGQRQLEEPPLWLPTRGHGSLHGTLFLRPEGPTTRLQMELHSAASRGLWAERLEGSLMAGGDRVEDLRLELTRSDAALLITGRAAWTEDEMQLALVLDSVSWPAEDAQAWLPFTLPVTGDLSGSLQLDGEVETLHGELRGELDSARVWNQQLDRLSGSLTWDADRLQVERLVAESEAGEIHLAGSLDRLADQTAFRLQAPRLVLGRSPLSSFVSSHLLGELALEATLQGTTTRPRLEGRILAKDLKMRGEVLGDDGTAEIVTSWDGEMLAAQGSLFGLASLEGGGPVDRQRADLSFAVESFDVPGLLQLATEEPLPSFSASARGRMEVTSQFTGGPSLAITMSLSDVTTEYQGRVLDNLEPVLLGFGGDGLTIESLYLAEEEAGGELFLSGRIGLGEDRPLDLRIQGSVSNSWMETMLPSLRVEGFSDIVATLRGTLREPRLNGVGEIRSGRLIHASFPHTFEELRGVVLFDPGEIVIDRLTSECGGGKVRVGGRVQLPTADRPAAYQLQATVEEAGISYPDGWMLRGDADLSIKSTGTGREIQGVIELDRAYYLEDIPVGLAQFLQREQHSVTEVDEWWRSTDLNLLVKAPNTVRVRNNVADLRGDANLVFRGSLAQPVVFGEVRAEPGGTLVYSETEYELERGLLTFSNPHRVDPLVDLVASTRIRDYEVTLSLSGRLDRLETSVASDPPLPTLQVVSLLTTGSLPGEPQDLTDTATTQTTEPSVGAAGLLYGQASSLISERVNTLFGLDRFRIDPLTGSGDALSSARVTMGKRFSKDVFVTYSVDPSSTEEQVLQVEWTVSPGLILVLTQNGDGSYSADARWERTF